MTHATNPAPCRAAISAAILAALMLAGCSSGNVGESWQCPLAAGGSCDSVAAADPAVPDPKAAGDTVLREPLWRVRAAQTDIPPARRPGQACPTECDGGFDPFAWLARLFAAEAREGDAGPARGSVQAPSATVARPSDPEPSEEAAAPAIAPPAALPAEPDPGKDDPDAGDLRTNEIVARIWIAPFVDANGVYREASHVRVVLEPAGWRLP